MIKVAFDFMKANQKGVKVPPVLKNTIKGVNNEDYLEILVENEKEITK